MIPLNLIGKTGRADYAVTGNFSNLAYKEAQMCIRDSYGDASCNARMGQQELDRFCALDSECQRLMPVSYTHLDVYKRQSLTTFAVLTL